MSLELKPAANVQKRSTKRIYVSRLTILGEWNQKRATLWLLRNEFKGELGINSDVYLTINQVESEVF